MKIEIYSKTNCVYCDKAVHIAQQIIHETSEHSYDKYMLDEDFTRDEAINTGELEFCPNEANWRQKLIMFGACALYFVKSFFHSFSSCSRNLLRCTSFALFVHAVVNSPFSSKIRFDSGPPFAILLLVL